MRATLTIEDAIDSQLEQIARRTGKSYKQVVNETLKRGLTARRGVVVWGQKCLGALRGGPHSNITGRRTQ